MSQRYFYFLVVWVLGFYGEVNGQENTLKGEIFSGYSTSLAANSYIPFPGGQFEVFPSHYLKKTSKANLFRWGLNRRQVPFTLESVSLFSSPRLNKGDKIGDGRLAVRPLFKIGGIYSPTPLAPYFDQLGFFCKKEIQLDRLTLMPVRFRLGSMEYVNWLEQKPNARRF